MDNLNILMNLKLLEINRDYIERNINYKKNLKKKIYKKINYQTGGTNPLVLNLDKISKLTDELKRLKDTNILIDQKDKLNKQINDINQYIQNNINDNIDINNIELQKIINNATMLVITEKDADKMQKESLDMQVAVEIQLDKFKPIYEMQIKSMKKILDESFKLYSDNKDYDKTSKTDKIREQLLIITQKLEVETKKNKSFYEQIELLNKINILDNFDIIIQVESTNPIDYYIDYYNNQLITKKEEFVSIFKFIGDIPSELAQFFTNDLLNDFDSINKNKVLFSKYKNKFNIFEIKKYLNSIIPNILLQENDILQDRIENKLLKKVDDVSTTKEQIIDTNELGDLFKLPSQVGGDLIDVLTSLINQANTEIQKLEMIKKELVTIVNKYNFEMNKLAYHNIFMIGVFNELFTRDVFVSMNYMNSGLILYYKNIVDKILSEINTNSDNDLILYFKKYHFLNLEIIQKILHASLNKLTNEHISDIINIRTSNENVRYAYLILNFLNTNLENYILNSNTNVTIYARINDWKNDIQNKLFTIDDKDFKILNVNEQNCKEHEKSSANKTLFNKQYNFTYVFGDRYDEQVLPTYMGLDTLLSQKKSLAMITYGYSGTGKTFTLFGNDQGKSGMLQTTIAKIKGLNEVYLRIFEIYGRGFQYPFYWDEKNKYQTIYDYKISIMNESELSLKKDEKPIIINNDKFDGFMKKDYKEYFKLKSGDINKSLQSLEKLVNEIDKVRKDNKRIRETPNNIESSRSIIVYDFTFIIGEKKEPVYFLIMDLPGRENIEITYIDNYVKVAEQIITNTTVSDKIEKDLKFLPAPPVPIQPPNYNSYSNYPFQNLNQYNQPTRAPTATTREQKEAQTELNKKNYPEYIKMLLFATSMQPLLIPIIDPEGFKEAIKTIDVNTNKCIIKLVEELEFNNLKKPNTNPERNFKTKDIFYILIEENKDNNKHSEVIINMGDDPVNLGGKYDLATRPISNNPNRSPTNNNFIIANWGIFYMNIIITHNKFEILERIIKHIIDKRFNDYIDTYCIKNIEKYKELLKICKKNYHDYLEKTQPENLNELKFTKDKVLYDYFMTPYEGLYINENIVGIIKYCEKINSPDGKSSVHPQDSNLNFNLQKTICRGLLLNPVYTKNVDSLSLDIINSSNEYSYYKCKKELFLKDPDKKEESKYYIYPLLSEINTEYKFNFVNIKKMYDQMSKYYDPSCIYNDGEEPKDKLTSKKEILIAKILSPYIGVENPRIKDFKIFYLFSNMNLEIKCHAQANLLDLTKNFIEAIVH
jgi:hypothetical protein